jgi:hypothetical protein
LSEPGGSESFFLVEREEEIQKVSIFAEDGPNGKSLFSILLEFDTGSNPSNHPRRTEEVTGLTLAVEDKEIPVLARLAGRKLGIFVRKSSTQINQEEQARTILELTSQIRDLEMRNKALKDQLQMANESLHRVS